MIGCLRAGGFSVAMAAHAFSLLDSYVYGFACRRPALPFDAADDDGGVVESILGDPPEAEYPHLRWLTVEHVLQPGYDYGDEFAFGLDLILDGLAAQSDEPTTGREAAQSERSSSRRLAASAAPELLSAAKPLRCDAVRCCDRCLPSRGRGARA